MAAKDRHDDKSFLARWSQRKQEAAEETVERETAAPEAELSPVAEEAVEVSALPDVDSLEVGSDFTVFMRAGVPEALKRRALRRLWQVDPAFHDICMLDDYNLDYTDAAMVVPNLKTLYQVGRGMVPSDEELEKAARAEASAASGGDGEVQAPASPTPPGAATETGVDEEPQDASANPPDAQAAPTESGVIAESRRPAPPSPATSGQSRSARRRRWGDVDV
jgi:hypothetical protein